MKTCRRCKMDKPLSEFNKRSGSKDGYQSYCRSCSNDSASHTYQKHQEVDTFLLREYLMKKQNSGCAICGRKAPLHLDHDHKDGTFRGLLCSNCNHGLGMFKDNPTFLQNAINYLADARLHT